MNENARRRRGLGRGLAALLGDNAVVAATGESPSPTEVRPTDNDSSATPSISSPPMTGATVLPIEALRSGRFQPRRHFDDTKLAELAQSIREHGLVQPILVRPLPGPEGSRPDRQYEIVAGERRWRAAQQAQLHEVPVVVRALDDVDSLQLGLIENVQRADLSAVEEATAYRRLVSEFGHTQEEIATALGKSRPHIANMLRLLDLPGPVLALVDDTTLTAGHARALIGTPDPVFLARHVADRGLSVRQTEQLAGACKVALGQGWDGKGLPPSSTEKSASPSRSAAPGKGKSADTRALEQRIETALGVRAELRQGKGEASELVLQFRDFDQLDEAVRRLTRH